MPDWFTHSLVGWITGKTLKLDISLVVAGSLIPDLVKLSLAFKWTGLDHLHIFDAFHTPLGAFLVAVLIALLFPRPKLALFFVSIGFVTHFFLDFLLVHVSGGIRLFFPLSWQGYHLSVIRADDYWVTVVAVLLSLFIYAVFWMYQKKGNVKQA